MKKNNSLKLAINFIPIIILFLLATYTPEFVKFSHTILGKIIAVVVILFYAKLDLIVGLFVCALVIFYYQTDYVESFNNMLNEGFTEKGEEGEDKDKGEQDKDKDKDKGEQDKDKDKDKGEQDKDKDTDKEAENFETLEDVYPENPNKNIIYDKSVDEFRKTHCEKGHLMHKGQIVKPEMAQHVYPQIQQTGCNKCNICNPTCQLNERMSIEEDIMKPKDSNDMFEKAWTNLKTSTEHWLSF